MKFDKEWDRLKMILCNATTTVIFWNNKAPDNYRLFSSSKNFIDIYVVFDKYVPP